MVMAAASLLSVSSSFLDQQVHLLTLKCQIWKFNRAFIKCKFNHQLLSEKHHEYLHLAANQTIKTTNQGPESGLKDSPHVPIYRQILGRVHHLGYKIVLNSADGILSKTKIQAIYVYIHTLPKAQQTSDFVNFDSFNKFSSNQKLQQALKSWSNFSSVL